MASPILFSFLFYFISLKFFTDCDAGIDIFSIVKLVNYSTSHASHLNLRFFKLFLEIFCIPITELVTQANQETRALTDNLSLCVKKTFSLSISLEKTVHIFQAASYLEPSIFADDHKLKLIDKFTYTDSVVLTTRYLFDENGN